MTKPYTIPKGLIMEAYRKVKANGGAFGVDKESLEDFEKNLKNNLYKIWNRMSSGSYFPPPVRGVSIPKKAGGMRLLGIPTVSDRIAQAATKMMLEPLLEPIFHKDSYGYRPGRSAHQALAITRERCWMIPWVVEFDIKGLFDNIDHDLMMKALRKHCTNPWIILYVERWLKVSIIEQDKSQIKRNKGTPQGGVISPLLANLFMHYAFDKWVEKHLTGVKFCRYADDGLLHCNSLRQAEHVLKRITERLQECKLEIHPMKSGIIYCKNGKRKEDYKRVSFTFLGYTFKPRSAQNREGKKFLNFSAGVSREAIKAMKQKLRNWKLQLKNNWSLKQISAFINPILQGWYQYYGKFYKTDMRYLWVNVNRYLCQWVRRKHRNYRKHKVQAYRHLNRYLKICQIYLSIGN